MKKFAAIGTFLLLLFGAAAPAGSLPVSNDLCDSIQGKPYAQYQNLVPAGPVLPLAMQGQGVSDLTSLKMADPSQPSVITYQVEHPQKAEFLLYTYTGSFASYEQDMSLYRLGYTGAPVNISQTVPCAVNGAGDVFIKGKAKKLYYHEKVDMPFFFDHNAPPSENLPRLGLNLEISCDGVSYFPVEPVLTRVEVYPSNFGTAAYGEWYQVSFPEGVQLLRLTLRNITQLAVHSTGEQRAADLRLELASTALIGGCFASPDAPPPDSSPQSPAEGSSPPPPPDISGSDSSASHKDDNKQEGDTDSWDDDGDSSHRFSSAATSAGISTGAAPPPSSGPVQPNSQAAEPVESTVSAPLEETLEESSAPLKSNSPFPETERGILLWALILSLAVFAAVYWLVKR